MLEHIIKHIDPYCMQVSKSMWKKVSAEDLPVSVAVDVGQEEPLHMKATLCEKHSIQLELDVDNLEGFLACASEYANAGMGRQRSRRGKGQQVASGFQCIKANYRKQELYASYITKQRKRKRVHIPCELSDDESITDAKNKCIKALRRRHHVPMGREMVRASVCRQHLFGDGGELAEYPAWGDNSTDSDSVDASDASEQGARLPLEVAPRGPVEEPPRTPSVLDPPRTPQDSASD